MDGDRTSLGDVGLIGLGVMGENLALNLMDHGARVVVWNRSVDKAHAFVAAHPGAALEAAADLADLTRRLARPRRLLLMVKAGAPVDETIARVKPLLEPGDVVMDGGNSWYLDSERRAADLAGAGIHYLGVGISGGEHGARHGPSIMPGGAAEAYDLVRPLLEAIAAKTGYGACVAHLGPAGAGHFVKMVHNGIEYADMQLIAEAYDLLRRAVGMTAPRMAAVFARWNEGPLASFLIDLTAKVLAVVEPGTGRPLVDLVVDQAGQKGTGRWTVSSALELGMPVPSIAAAVDARALSAHKQERVAAAARIPVPEGLKAVPGGEAGLEAAVHDALLASKVVAYAQGMALIRRAALVHGWGTDLAEVARVWTGGCIIRARLLTPIMGAFQREPALPNLLLDPTFDAYAHHTQAGWRDTIGAALRFGVPAPAMSAGLAYYDGYRAASLPHNLIQAQRDAFGAHTYERVDRPGAGPVHTEWLA